MTDNTKEAIGQVLGRTPSGVFILTASDGEGRSTGMLASWVQQAAFEPPTVTVAVNSKRYLNDWLKGNPKIGLNLVGEGKFEFLKHFGKGFEPDEPAFEGLNTTLSPLGLKMLEGAQGYMEGQVTGKMAAGDHIIYLLEIEHAQAGDGILEAKPMVHIRKNGFGY